ncbi:MAG: hypothetical protein FWH18_03155 [Marinilabiliaceae bacterium]|nr:hypothetical protein [Marinilabiliaceae bacterium]
MSFILVFCIPFGMQRLVENSIASNLHSVRMHPFSYCWQFGWLHSLTECGKEMIINIS